MSANCNCGEGDLFALAVSLGCIHVARILHNAGTDINTCSTTLAPPPVISAVQRTDIPLLEWLLSIGADVNATDADGKTAWDHAGERGHTQASLLLLDAMGPHQPNPDTP